MTISCNLKANNTINGCPKNNKSFTYYSMAAPASLAFCTHLSCEMAVCGMTGCLLGSQIKMHVPKRLWHKLGEFCRTWHFMDCSLHKAKST